ncbi:hypothetical protein Tsubulata_028063 [Turnera subulata]|uniref:DUF4283 domain-containing protein n=1 Tax=Turnera subulata TaxID=218843 RepID=A0A9Q0FDK6_9ROSI|nr:hypothetical protein Tsubulata_028063 [Turnera subulata]
MIKEAVSRTEAETTSVIKDDIIGAVQVAENSVKKQEDCQSNVIDLGASHEQPDLPEEMSLGAIVARTYAIGKVFAERRLTPSQIYSQMNEIWYIKGKFRVIPIPNNLFLLCFEHEEDCRHVLKGSPWLVPNLHFCLKPWTENLSLSQMRAREVYGKHYSGQKSFARTTQQAPLDAADATGDRVPPRRTPRSVLLWTLNACRATPVEYRTSAEEWVKAHENGETYNDVMGVVVPIPFGDPQEPPAGYPIK